MLASLLLIVQIKSAECSVACRYLGYDGGFFEEEHCVCLDKKDYDETVNVKRTVAPKKRHAQKKTIIEDAF